MKTTVALLACVLTLHAQVSILATPQPKSVARALHVKISLWVIRACNEGPQTVTISEERTAMAVPQIRLEPSSLAMIQTAAASTGSVWATIARWIGFGGSLALVLMSGGLIAAGTRALAAVGVGSVAAATTSAFLLGQAPNLMSLQSQLLAGSLTLGPAGSASQCATRLAVGPVPKGSASVSAKVLK